jgi:hypothetical protein
LDSDLSLSVVKDACPSCLASVRGKFDYVFTVIDSGSVVNGVPFEFRFMAREITPVLD